MLAPDVEENKGSKIDLAFEGAKNKVMNALEVSHSLEEFDQNAVKQKELLSQIDQHIKSLEVYNAVLRLNEGIEKNEDVEKNINECVAAEQRLRNKKQFLQNEIEQADRVEKHQKAKAEYEQKGDNALKESVAKVLKRRPDATFSDRYAFWRSYESSLAVGGEGIDLFLTEAIEDCMIQHKFSKDNASAVISSVIERNKTLKGMSDRVKTFNDEQSRIGSLARKAPWMFGSSLAPFLAGTAFIAYCAVIGETSSYRFIGSIAVVSLSIPLLVYSAIGLNDMRSLNNLEKDISRTDEIPAGNSEVTGR